MVSSSSDTLSFTLVTHAALSHQPRLSDISCGCSRLQSNCIFYCFKGKNLFYFLLTHFQVRPPLLCCCQKGAISSQGQCSWGLPRWWPYAEAVKLQGDFARDIPLCSSTTVGVSGPRCQTSYLGFKEHRLISFVFHLIHHSEGSSKVRPWSPFSGSWNSEFTKPGRRHERFIYRIS